MDDIEYMILRVRVTWGSSTPYTVKFAFNRKGGVWTELARGYDNELDLFWRMHQPVNRERIRGDRKSTMWHDLAGYAVWQYEQFERGLADAQH